MQTYEKPAVVPPREHSLTVFGVPYVHLRLPDNGDLYLTEHGLPWRDQLMPDMFWTDQEWFRTHSLKLFGHDHTSPGSGTIYRVATKPVHGSSRDIVMKWNRMAQDVPGHQEVEELLTAEFNSPFEEFAVLTEMRSAWRELHADPVRTHKPLAIYVPPEKIEPWRVGRKDYMMDNLIKAHTEVQLDSYRRYAVIYEWIKGIDLQEAFRQGIVSEQEMKDLTLTADQDLSRLGFTVRDRKPQHIIVRVDKDGQLLWNRTRGCAYALVDFELLERTPEREQIVKAGQRKQYLHRQAHRFDVGTATPMPAHMCGMTIMGVDYVCGTAESTGGRLWVVGRDPELFDFFLPERWEHTPRTRLSDADEVYETITKDDIHVVWKLSHVGEYPNVDPFKPDERSILDYGYNSPFEEVALALELSGKGVPVTMPRAVYETHHESARTTAFGDQSRYVSHDELAMPDGTRVLRQDRDYIVIWGFWNKPDESLAVDDTDHYQPVNALSALQQGILGRKDYINLMRATQDRLARLGYEDLHFGGSHKVLSLDSSRRFVRDRTGQPEMRICNFELMRRLRAHG